MSKYDEHGLSQKIMTIFSGVAASTINRYVVSKNLMPISDSSKRNSRYSIQDTRIVLSEFIRNRHPIATNKKIQSFYNFKGGTGKTTICFQVATHLALAGYKVLAVDADPQGHFSTSLGFDSTDDFPTLYDSLVKNIPIRELIRNVYDGLDCIPSNLSLTKTEVDLNHIPKREERLQKILSEVENEYDFIIIDTNPTISHLNRNVITASNVLNIVCETQPYSLNGLKILMEDLKNFTEIMQISKMDITIIPNKYEDRSNSSAEAMAALSQFYNQYIIKDFAIRKSEDFVTAAKLGLPISFFGKINSIALADIKDLLQEIIKKSEVQTEQLNIMSA
ncbi:MAG: AAA family ATPase [Alphaproteobacteria bacterium]|nr:AAA family ATPase [Alphaproteobacteria bacterium]